MGNSQSLDRLAAFVDAVVAIAITLLILPLVDRALDFGADDVQGFFTGESNALLGFALSFVVIAAIWYRQHRFFEGLKGYASALVPCVMVWVFAIVVLPLPTAMISEDSHEPLANVFYIGTILVASLASLAQEWIVHRTPEIAVDPEGRRFDVINALETPVVLLFGLVVTAAFPEVGLWPLALLAITGPLAARFSG